MTPIDPKSNFVKKLDINFSKKRGSGKIHIYLLNASSVHVMLAHLGTSFLLLLRSLQLLPHYKAWLADNCCTQLLHLPFWENKEPSFIQPHSSNLSLLSLFLSFSRSVIFSYYKQSNTWDQCLAKLTQLLRLSSIFRNIKEWRRSGETKNVLWRIAL